MGKKETVLKEKGIILRHVTEKDRKKAKTDLQRTASFVITTANGQEYYSKNGSLKDCLWADKNSKATAKKATKPKATKSAPKKSTAKKTTAKTKKTACKRK